MADFSPMMRQYFDIKEGYPNTLLFFRLGDFYELFFTDAKIASKELELTLTGRDCGQEDRAPMCGVPFHSAESYIARLVAKGYKVAICEQTEEPTKGKGIVKREVVRVITPGTVLESSMLDEGKNNFICSLYYDDDSVGLTFSDITTGELLCTQNSFSKRENLYQFVINELSRFSPKEILLNPEALSLKGLDLFIKERLFASVECVDEMELDTANNKVKEQFLPEYLEEAQLFNYEHITVSLASLFDYLKKTQMIGLERITKLQIYSEKKTVGIDINTRRNLELSETMRNKEKRGSLLWVLDKTKTAMGKRLIRSWIEQPLLNPAEIAQRHNAVEELFNDKILSDNISELLSDIYDIERIMTRIVYGSANGRELRFLCSVARLLPNLRTQISQSRASLLKQIYQNIDELEDLCELIERSIVDEPPFSIREGGVIRDGYNEELDEIRRDMKGGKNIIAEIENSEKEKTGITKLKISYNRVFGYYLEVSNSYKNLVPDHYIRKQTLTNCERYITEELKQLEGRILGAQERSISLEGILFEQIRKQIAAQLERVQATANAISKLDVLNSFATVSYQNSYVRPNILLNGRLYIKDGRHPVVEALLKDSQFVPNDTDMDMADSRISVITGPNMAGKSTFMRQVAVIVIMAQMGCFVPAQSASISIIDNIFTRVGASDDLAAGQSTFMIEMTELADILKNATKDSLIILDEIGRGTSTFDGMSIARSVLEYIHNKKKIGAKTLFATHYHEMTDLENELDGIKNYNVAVKRRGDDITFLRKIIRGGCDDSYGIQVAKLAGVPNKVIDRAKDILKGLEDGVIVDPNKGSKTKDIPLQFTLDTVDNAVIGKIRALDVNTLTPMECMNTLFELSNMLK